MTIGSKNLSCLASILAFISLVGCEPQLVGFCSENDLCIEGYLCNQDNQCEKADNLIIASDHIPDAILMEKYSWGLAASGGIKPYTWKLQSDLTWAKLDENTGEITGAPESCTLNANLKISVTDNRIGPGNTIEKEFSMSIVICMTDDDQACSGHGVCLEENSNLQCECNLGYKGDTCNTCKEGFVWNDLGTLCVDIDECTQRIHDCHETLAVCLNTPGTYECECKPGYQGNGKVCTDIDECELIPKVCEDPLQCINDTGSHRCLKPNGLECEESEECLSDHCVEEVCCDKSCEQPCFSCKLENHFGECKGVFPGVDPTGKCGVCHACDASHACTSLNEVDAPPMHCPDTTTECGDTGRCVAGACEKQPLGYVCNNNQMVCDNTDPLNPLVAVYRCDGLGDCVDETQTCNGYLCKSEQACHQDCDIQGCAEGYNCIDDICTRWIDLSDPSYNGSADLVSDSVYLYRVGGYGVLAKKIYRYTGPPNTTWDLVTDQNPTGGYAHMSPGEGNRAWMHAGKIILAGHSHSSPSHPGSKNVVMYDIDTNTWSVHDLPVFDEFNGYGHGGVLNIQTGEIYISWTEESHPFATAVLDVETGIWGETYDRDSGFGDSLLALDSTSDQYVFGLKQSGQYLYLKIYDLVTQPQDFTGTWKTASFDMGPGRQLLDEADFGCGHMVWNPEQSRLYIIGGKSGFTITYDPVSGIWKEIDRRPAPEAFYRNGSLAVLEDWLYHQVGTKFWALDLRLLQ